MKIYIKNNEGFKLKLWLPSSFLKRKFILKMISNNDEYNEKLKAILPKLYGSLKQFIKKNGHFTLVEINSADGEKIIIKI